MLVRRRRFIFKTKKKFPRFSHHRILHLKRKHKTIAQRHRIYFMLEQET